MATISRLFPELEKEEKSPSSDSMRLKTDASSEGTSPRHENSGIDSCTDSGRVSTPASLVDEPRFIKTEKTPNSFRPWEEPKEDRVPDLHSCAQEQPTQAALNPFANWALNYPLFSQAAAVAAIQQNAALAAINQNQIHQHHQNQLLQQLFITQQQKNMQAYNAYRLQNELKSGQSSVERPWESQTAATKMETDSVKVEKPKPKEKKENGNKPYKCPICDAQFNRPANLKTHLRIHSGEKPYKCDTCSARFVQVAHLRAHVLIHTGEKPYPCQVCGTRFRHLQTLKSHIRIHTGEKPFSCDECDLKFRHKSQLRLHLRTKHNINTNTKKSYTFVPGLNSADLSKIIKDSNKTTSTSSLTVS